ARGGAHGNDRLVEPPDVRRALPVRPGSCCEAASRQKPRLAGIDLLARWAGPRSPHGDALCHRGDYRRARPVAAPAECRGTRTFACWRVAAAPVPRLIELK